MSVETLDNVPSNQGDQKIRPGDIVLWTPEYHRANLVKDYVGRDGPFQVVQIYEVKPKVLTGMFASEKNEHRTFGYVYLAARTKEGLIEVYVKQRSKKEPCWISGLQPGEKFHNFQLFPIRADYFIRRDSQSSL